MPTRDPETWMWAEAFDLMERAERMQRQFFRLGRTVSRRPTWEPPVDIFENGGELWIQVALMGVEPEQVQAVIDGGVLIVAGERRLPQETRGAVIHRLEIPHGRFERRVALPAGRFKLGRRELVNGCLVLTLLKLD